MDDSMMDKHILNEVLEEICLARERSVAFTESSLLPLRSAWTPFDDKNED